MPDTPAAMEAEDTDLLVIRLRELLTELDRRRVISWALYEISLSDDDGSALIDRVGDHFYDLWK